MDFVCSSKLLLMRYNFLKLVDITVLVYLDIHPLLLILFVNISSLSAGSLFVLLMVSFDGQKLLSLITSHLFTFAFVCFSSQIQKKYWECCWGQHLQKSKERQIG